MIGMLVTGFYNLIDAYFVGGLRTSHVASGVLYASLVFIFGLHMGIIGENYY